MNYMAKAASWLSVAIAISVTIYYTDNLMALWAFMFPLAESVLEAR